ALFRAAHKLKGSVANFNDNACTNLALDVETAGRDRDLGRAASVMPRLEEAVATLSRRIAAASANLRSVRS
ncbi:MAG TPA: Hpt domain-containing protein, partial [Thermoanaerobaculia bacterium]